MDSIVLLQNPYAEALTLNMIAFVDGGFWVIIRVKWGLMHTIIPVCKPFMSEPYQFYLTFSPCSQLAFILKYDKWFSALWPLYTQLP